MPSLHPTNLESFHQFLGRQLASEAAAQMSPEQALALWREHEAAVAAIREGLADLEAGRVRPADEVLGELRAELNDA